MKKDTLNHILNIVMGSFCGFFIGYGLYSFIDYRARPGLYAMQSAPWYIGTLLYGIVTASVLLVCLLLKRIIRKK